MPPLNPVAASFVISIAVTLSAVPIGAQKIDEAARQKNHAQLVELLKAEGPAANLSFEQSKTQPYNYSANLSQGLTNTESIEVVFHTTAVNTYFMYAYPKLKGAYVNIDKAKNKTSLMRQLLALNHSTYLHWGIDPSGDVFMGFTLTLESGFPAEAIRTVLRSIVLHDRFIGDLRKAIG